MRGMILRTVLLCIGTVLAFPTLEPHLPQTIDCPNSDIHVFVNQSAVDRKEYTFVDWNAANLQDCIQKCFGNHFCYSIRFDAALDHNCALYYFAAYNCSNQALTKASTIDYKGGSITLDCIRCPGRGDFVTAPPFSSIGEQTIVSETAVLARGKNIKGTATEITHNSENEGKPHAEVEGDTGKGKETVEGKEGVKGEIEGSGTGSDTGASTGTEKTDEQPVASTETTLTGTESGTEGSTQVPSSESSDATTASPEGETGATSAEPGTESESGGTTTASTDEAAGSVKAPGSEAGSTPSDKEESSTVEGSGEEETTGESNGETETIGESSGEGAPTTSESSSGAPGIRPSDESVEGSGVEGSGLTSPEIALQEEEEAKEVNVDVETTTAWNGHTEQPRECSGSLRFVPSSTVDLDTVQLLINSTKANSPAECAKICYEHNCGFAYYEPSSFICQYMANTEDIVDSSTCPTDHKDAKYQAEFRTDVASTLTCAVCAKESEVDKAKPALQPVASPRRGSYPACIISFQAAEGDHSSFPFYKSIQVSGLNACARHCFIGECSQSVYNPKTKECRLGSNPKDTCNNLPLIQKVPAPSEEVLLQCLRCIPEDLIGVKGTVSETTGYREPPTAAESIDEAAATANREKEQSAAAAAAATTTPEPAATTETVTEAATTEAATTESPVETTSIDESAAVANREEEQSAVASTTPEPAATTEAVTEAATTEATPEETTTIAGSGDEVELTEPLPAGVTEAPEETTTVTESTTTEEETTPIGGAEVELEEASGEEETTTTSSIEVTSSGYDSTTASSTGEAVAAEGKDGEHGATTTVEGEGSGEEEAASTGAPKSEANQDYEATTAAGAAEKEEGIAAATTPAGEESTTGAAAEGATTEGVEATTGGEEAATTAAGEEGSTAAGAAEGETTTVGGEEGASTAAAEGSSTLSPEETATTESGAEESTLSSGEAATSEGPGEMSKAIEANDKPLILASEDIDFGKSCVIKFQSAPFSDRPSTLTAPFEKTFPVDSIELCATRCFQDGCSSAKYEPESKTCHLAYEDKPTCDRSELHLRMSEVTGDTWIHCVNCYPEKSVVKDVLGSALNKTEGEKETEEGKESMLDKVVGAVSDVAHSVAETVTGQSPDTVLKHGCIVNFQTSLTSEMADKVEYLPPFKTRYAHRCATKCFQEGCAAATFNPSTSECSLGYGRSVKCGNTPLVTTAMDIKETITMHCMSCIHHKSGDGGVDLVVLSPDDARIHVSESQDVPAEEVEGSGTGDATVSPVAGVESTTGGAETTSASSDEASTVTGTEEGTTAAGAEEGSTVSGTEETTTVAGEGSGTESTVAEGEGASTASSAEPTTVSGEESTTEGLGEVNGGTLGEEGSGALEGPGTGKIKEVPLETAADGVQLPKGVNLETGEVDGKVQVNGEKEGKFKPSLPAGFSIDSGPGRVQVDGKMPEGGKTGAEEGEKGSATGTAGAGEKPSVAGTGATAGEEPVETGESSTAAPTESTTTGEGTESSTGLTTGEETGESTTASTDSSSTTTPSESSTDAGETSTLGEETSTGHGIIHPAKEFEHTPLHPTGEEVEVGSAEVTTDKGEEGVTAASKDSESTTATEEATTEEEGPAFVQESPSEDEEKEEGLAISHDDLKHREGLLEKALATANPKEKTVGESTTGTTVSGEKPAAGESIDSGLTTAPSVEEGEVGKSTVAPVESSTGVTPTETAAGSSTTEATTVTSPVAQSTSEGAETSTTAWNASSGGEIDAMAAQDATASQATTEETTSSSIETSTDAESTAAPTTAATVDLQHREGILEKALASANPAATTKGGELGESTTPSSESTDTSSSTVEPTIESTVASSTESAAPEGSESTVAASTEGSVSTEGGESTVAASTEGTVTEGVSTIAPVDGMAASIDEKTKEEAKEVEEELATKGEVKENGEKGVTAASLDTGSSTVAPSTSVPAVSTTTVLSPADLAKNQHHEKGGAEFGQTGQRGTEAKEVEEEAARKGEVKLSGAKGAAGTSSSLDASSTATPSDSTATADVATGELTTSSSIDGAGGLAREGVESTTSTVEESTAAESTTGAAESSDTTVATSEATEETSTASSDGAESSTVAASESTDTTSSIDSERLIQTALATAAPKIIEEHIPTTAVPSPADLAKVQHHEKGGAEFGQAGQRGSEGTIGQQEDAIHSSTISPVEASTSSTGESLDGGIDRALSAIGEKTTTEPPVQAVKDLLDALASGDFDKALLGKKTNGTGTEADKLLKGNTQITEQATPINQKHEGQTFFEHDHTVDITTLHAIDDSIVTVPSPQGISKNCDGGRIEFQFVPAGSLPRLNVTNDVPARTPADCARKCHETKGCTTAGFIPTPSADIANGVCLLTSDDEVCISRDDAVPQHASVTAFVISCIRCTSCSYTLSHMTLSSSTAKFQHIATVKTIGECAEVCHDKKCVFAQYDATTNTCALSMEASLETGCNKVEPPLAVKGAYPVRLECVQCRE